jgi:tetratricopeptide (TPR) repeat protein
MLRLAIQREPSHAGAHAWLAYWDLFLVGQGWAEEPQATSEEAGTLSDRALSLEPDDAHFITLAGHVRAFLARRPEEGIALHRHAINLNPNLPMAWAFLGLAQTYLGLHDEGLVSIEQATRLSPVDPHGFFFEMALTMPHLLKRNYSAVVDIGRRAIQLNPAFSSAYKGFLAALGHLGLTSEAERVRTRLLRIEPRLTLADAVRRSPMQRDEDVAHYAEGLRLAGLS